MKYYLDLMENSNFDLVAIEDSEIIYSGNLAEAGITEEEDGQWTNKLDDFFQKELGITPDEWEVG